MSTVTINTDTLVSSLIASGFSRIDAERALKVILQYKRDLKYLPFDTQQEYSKLTTAGFSEEQANALVQFQLTSARALLMTARDEFKSNK